MNILLLCVNFVCVADSFCLINFTGILKEKCFSWRLPCTKNGKIMILKGNLHYVSHDDQESKCISLRCYASGELGGSLEHVVAPFSTWKNVHSWNPLIQPRPLQLFFYYQCHPHYCGGSWSQHGQLRLHMQPAKYWLPRVKYRKYNIKSMYINVYIYTFSGRTCAKRLFWSAMC